LYYREQFHNPTSVERQWFNCKIKQTNANQGNKHEAQNIWVEYMQCEENDLIITIQGQIPSFSALLFSKTVPNHNLDILKCLPAGKPILTIWKWCKKTQQWVLHPQDEEYPVVIPTKFNGHYGWADCVDRFVRIVKQTNIMHCPWWSNSWTNTLCAEEFFIGWHE
jgi:hypothetical protein